MSWPATVGRAAPFVLLAGGIACLIVTHVVLFFSSWTDENVHAYVARRVSEGAVLYRDIDSARPPLVILPLAGLIRIGLAPLLAARTMVVLTTLGVGAILLFAGRRLFSLRAGVLAAAIFLLAPEVVARPQYTGIHLVQLGATACLMLALLGRPLAAGAVFGVALGAGQHSLIIGSVAGLWLVYRQRRQGLLFVAGAAAALLAVFGLARVMGGQHLWENLIARHLYHLGGAEVDEKTDFGRLFGTWLADHLIIFALAAAALLRPRQAGAGRALRERSDVAARVVGAAIGLHLIAVMIMSGAQFLYVIPIFPLVCLLAGWGAEHVIGWVAKAPAGSERLMRAGGTAAVAVIVTLLGWRAGEKQAETAFLPVLPLDPYTRSVELVRVQKLDVLKTIARDLNGKLSPGETLFGHGPVVAQAAVEGGRRVAGELADLAPRWIEQGVVTPGFVIGKIENDAVGALVTPLWLLVQNPQFRSYLQACYQRPQRYPRPRGGDGRGLPDLYVFLRKKVARPCSTPPTGAPSPG
jgi:hypothetical protein